MGNILDGLSLVDVYGRTILLMAALCLLAAVAAHAFLRIRYQALKADLERNAGPTPRFDQPVLRRIVAECEDAARQPSQANVQTIIEDVWQKELGSLLLLERFVRAATGLVLVLGLLGTFYGLTLAIGRLVHLVTADPSPTSDVGQAVAHGLTEALTGMAVAFSNSLVGVGAAVVLTALGIVHNVTDRRTALMVQIEAYLDRFLATRAPPTEDIGRLAGFAQSIARLEAVVTRFESALRGFASSTNDLREVKLVVALQPGERG
jgi:hypothetical protein